MTKPPSSGERDLIEKIGFILSEPSRRVQVGIGDDAAVVDSPVGKMVVTVDCQVEGVHFKRSHITLEELGHRSLAVNLSDIAAMGAEPLYAVVSLFLPDSVSTQDIQKLYRGMENLQKEFELDIVGGNVSKTQGPFIVDVTLIGESKETPLTRRGARPGDVVAVTGSLGASAVGFQCLEKLGREATQLFPEVTQVFLTPKPQVVAAQALKDTGGVTAMIDISDGLASELYHLSEASGVGFQINEEALPISEPTLRASEFVQASPQEAALFGGEDYELLFTVAPHAWKDVVLACRAVQCPITNIGEATDLKKIELIQSGRSVPLERRGWSHR